MANCSSIDGFLVQQLVKQVLLVAYHFPPCGSGSGVHRASGFARYLAEYGWRVHVITAVNRAYVRVDPRPTEGKESVRVTRAFALDAKRHLSVRGRYLDWMALPDRWVTWVLGAVPVGVVSLYRKRMDVILVTYPIATAVLIGWILNRLTGRPLVVDFRDPMSEPHYPRDALRRSVAQWIERAVIRCGARFIFTTASTRRTYLERYPNLKPGRCVVIPNGYEEDEFRHIDANHTLMSSSSGGAVRIVHAGLIYPRERDPTAFFSAVQSVKQLGAIGPGNVRIDLRASGSEDCYSQQLQDLGIDDVIRLLPALPYREALQDMASADALLLLQSASCRTQIPAKVYEYLRLGKPILALTSADGDTASLLKRVGGATVVDLADADSIARILPEFIASVRLDRHPLPDRQEVQKLTRKNGAAQLARCLDGLAVSVATGADCRA